MVKVYTEEEIKKLDTELWHPRHIKQLLEDMRRCKAQYSILQIALDDSGMTVYRDGRKDTKDNTSLSDFLRTLVSCMTDADIKSISGSIHLTCGYDDDDITDVFPARVTLVARSLLTIADENRTLGWAVKRFNVSRIVEDIESEIAESEKQQAPCNPHKNRFWVA